eukprot:gene4373-4189_t
MLETSLEAVEERNGGAAPDPVALLETELPAWTLKSELEVEVATLVAEKEEE